MSIPASVPKEKFSSFVFSVVFQQKICWSSDQWFQNGFNYIEMAWKTKIQTEEKNNETEEQSERGNCLRKCFDLFKYIADQENVCFSSWFHYKRVPSE